MAGIVLALDLGSKTGWAIGTKESHVSGVWDLKGSRFSGGGMRFVHFRARLEDLKSGYGAISAVYYEEVRRHAGTDAAHIYGGLQAILAEWCETNHIPYEGVSVGTIKKSFCGRGNADKAAMIARAVELDYLPIDSNEADAIALFRHVTGLSESVALGVAA